MRCEDFDGLDVARFDVKLSALDRTLLPPYLGSTLRGAFGHALKLAISPIENGECDACSVSEPCVYHYLFETPVPPGATQLRGQREAPVPFILSPPVIENPVKRVRRLSASQRSSPAVRSSSAVTPSLSRRAGLSVLARNPSDPQSAICNPQFAVTSVTFPDQRRLFGVGDDVSFGLTLIGRAIVYLPQVILAMNEMARRGLGASRAQFKLKEVWLKSALGRNEAIWANGAFLESQVSRLLQVACPLSELIRRRLTEVKDIQSKEEDLADSSTLESTIAYALRDRELRRGDLNGLASGNGQSARRATLGTNRKPVTPDQRRLLSPNPKPPTRIPNRLRLRFFTPIRIRVKGDLQTSLSFELLVQNLLRRVSMLTAVHGERCLELDYRGLIERAGAVRTIDSKLRWWDLERYTNRQEGKLRVGGLIGEVKYEGDAIGEFLPLLVAGELLNIGTGTSFGLGSYELLLKH